MISSSTIRMGGPSWAQILGWARAVRAHGAMIAGLAVAVSAPLIVSICGVLIYGQMQADAQLRRQVDQSQQRRDLIAAVLETTGDAETGQRGYLLTGEDRYLAPYDGARARLAVVMPRLRSAWAGGGAADQRIGALERLTRSKLDELAQTIALARAGDHDRALRLVRSGLGQDYMVNIRRLSAELLAGENADIAARTEALQQNTRATVAMATALAALMVTIIVGSGVLLIAAMRERGRIQQRLEQAVAAKAEFLANMSHELRTPMTSVIGYSKLLLIRSDLTDEARKLVARVDAAGKALLATVNDVLDFSKLEAGRVEIKLAAMAPSSLMAEADLLFSPEAQQKGLIFTSTLADTVPDTVLADADRLRQVLVNLIGNALKFTAAGSVGIAVTYAGDRLRIEVADTGPGLSPAQIGMLFQRFSQVGDGARKGGTGLGLAICRGLVEAMGGTIGVRSALGAGATFWFEIPAARAASAGAETRHEQARIPGVRVLVVDDVEANRDFASTVLTAAGAEVSIAMDGRTAVRAAHEAPFDVILMDLQMHDMEGGQAALLIREGRGPNAAIPILAFTANGSRDAWRRSPAHVFDDQVSKPLAPEALVDVIASWSMDDLGDSKRASTAAHKRRRDARELPHAAPVPSRQKL